MQKSTQICRPVKLINLNTGEEKIFISQRDACRNMGIHSWSLKQILKGIHKSTRDGWSAVRLDGMTSEQWIVLNKHTTSKCITCKVCNKDFWYKKHRTVVKFCSDKCKKEYHKTHSRNGLLQRNIDGLLLCYQCLEYKTEDSFYIREDTFDIRNKKATRCKKCQTENNKNSRLSNSTNLISIISRRLITAKTSSTSRNIYFDNKLTKNDLLEIYNAQKGICAISGQILAINANKTPFTISLDRKDSTKGYTRDNIQLVCWAVNQMKNDYSLDELIKWCAYIVANNKEEYAKINN